jgi:hypothetical protein
MSRRGFIRSFGARLPAAGRSFARAGLGLTAALGGGLLAISASRPTQSQGVLGEVEELVIRYSDSSDLADPVAQLRKRIEEGKAKLLFEPKRGYLSSLLKNLKIPTSSQGLVFSKTSSQIAFISPETPRALYFNDNVYVAWTQGGSVIDIIAIDPEKGSIFYTLDQEPSERPAFQRDETCMRCHLGPKTVNVPGLVVNSTFTAPDGRPLAMCWGS